MITTLQQAAVAFRIGAEGNSQIAFIEILEALEYATTHPTAHSSMPELGECLAGLMSAHSRGDWTGAADILEYQVLPLVDSNTG